MINKIFTLFYGPVCTLCVRDHNIVLCVLCLEAQRFTTAETTWTAQEEAILWLSSASVDPPGCFLPLVFYER